MKELSIEEKAKRYDEAIEKLRDFYRDYDTVSRLIDVKEELANLFPELKESEDERIKKEMLTFFKGFYDNQMVKAVDVEPWIAWLEKQGEQEAVPNWMPKFLDELRSKKNYFDWDEHRDIEGSILAIIKWMNPNYFNEKDGGQKPAEWMKVSKKDVLKNLIG